MYLRAFVDMTYFICDAALEFIISVYTMIPATLTQQVNY